MSVARRGTERRERRGEDRTSREDRKASKRRRPLAMYCEPAWGRWERGVCKAIRIHRMGEDEERAYIVVVAFDYFH